MIADLLSRIEWPPVDASTPLRDSNGVLRGLAEGYEDQTIEVSDDEYERLMIGGDVSPVPEWCIIVLEGRRRHVGFKVERTARLGFWRAVDVSA